MSRPAERSDLDKILSGKCGNPDCDCGGGPMYLHPRCHSHSLAAFYEKGLMHFECDQCGRPVGVFRVHDDVQPPIEAFKEIAARATKADLKEIKADIERRLWEVLGGIHDQ